MPKWQRIVSKKRFFSSVIMIFLTVSAIILDWALLLLILALTVGGLYEFFYMIKKKGIPIYSYMGIFIGVMIPVSIYSGFELTRNWELLFITLAFLTILLLQFARKDNSNAIVGISTTMFGVFYVSWLFSFLIKIRFLLDGWAGIKLLSFILLVTKMGDIGALLIGSWIGKHPLLPRVSPNKSIEGGAGSLVFSVVTALLVRSFLPEAIDFKLWHVALMGAFFGGIGQLGDLSESLMKRDCNVKDSGKLLPGLGGVLDIIDSLLFSAPSFYLYMSALLASV
ncbi:MAG: phosphatidate cytidylyltransferase [Candidatus Omnitrophica bacterium]|nr:phosphatidate cytidylyltransferase [Candidatus Omnitrophota bacterium]